MKTCKKCVLENSSLKLISFDENGICNYCHEYRKRFDNEVMFSDSQQLGELVKKIKNSKKGDYDCVIGVSGGIDSSYVIIKAKELGLSPLAVHLDNGWNTELAVHNIEKLLDKLDVDLITHVLEWEEFRDLQLSFLKASVINAEIPTDHAINALLFKIASKKKIRYILSGSNVATEAIMPEEYGGYDSFDWKHIKSIHNIFGTKKLSNYPHLSNFHWFYYTFVKSIKYVPFLNYFDFDKSKASKLLKEEFNWELYPQKHYESFFTKFFQAYILPQKFNIDKRKAHFSCLINSGELTRAEAVEKLGESLYDDQNLKSDINYFINKMNIDKDSFDTIMNKEPKSHFEYPNNLKLFRKFKSIVSFAKKTSTLRR